MTDTKGMTPAQRYNADFEERYEYKILNLCPAPNGTFGVYRVENKSALVVRIPLLAVCDLHTFYRRKQKGALGWKERGKPIRVVAEVEHDSAEGFTVCNEASNYLRSLYMPEATPTEIRARVLELCELNWEGKELP